MKKILLFAFPMLLASLFAGAQSIYTQDFESGLPADWTLTGEWELTDAAGAASQYYAPGAHTMFMNFNDDGLGQTAIASGRVISGPIDLSAATGTLVLNFDSYFVNGDYQGADETGKIYVSTDAGTTWTEIFNLEVTGDWQQVGAILDYAGQTVMLAFEYNDGGGWNYGWSFDNLDITNLSGKDASIDFLNKESFLTGGIVGGKVYPGGTVTNRGVEVLNSVDLTWSTGGTVQTETITGLNLAYGESTLIESTMPYTIEDGTSIINVSISNMNGTGDDENLNNNDGGTFEVTSFTPNLDKAVVVEEATGTWCQWCPRGAVFLDLMTKRYGKHFVGIAVHNADPMVLTAYDDAIGNFPGFSGYPSVVFNRTNILDPSEIEAPFQTAALQSPPAILEVGAAYDDATRELTVSVGAEFLQNVGAGFKLNAIIIEDDVTGTTAAYAQANSYSGGGNGPMGGYELLPGSVPANQMVYDHVGRALLGGYEGATGSLPDAATSGQVFGHTFPAYTIPAGYDTDNIHIVSVITNAAGRIVNAKSSTIAEAVTNGLFVSGTKEVVNNDLISVSPNPFSSTTNVSLNLATSAEVTMQVYDAVGKLVVERNYGELSGAHVLPFDGSSLTNGMYFLHVRMDDVLSTKRVYLSK